MELTTRIFRDLAVLANWAFQASICEPGAYKLAEVAKNKDGKFNIDRDALQTSSLPECATWHDESEYIVKLSYNGGMQEYTFGIDNIFDLLARFKKIATKGIKAKEKDELCTMTKGNRDEILNNTVRAKVLQYKPDGNTLTEKWESLTNYADGIYYVDKGTINGDIANFVFEKNGIYWDAMRCDRVEYIEARRDILIADLRNFETNVISRAERGMFINTLHIEVMRRLGYDTAPLYASRNAYLKRREEEEKRKREEEQRREMERKEAEERRKSELLADGKKKLLNGEKITVEQIELIAEAVGYKINIRTLGTMRKKLVSMSYSEANGWDYSYYSGKNTSDKSFNGAMDLIKSIYMMLKSEESERENTTDTGKEPEKQTESICTVITIAITGSIRQAIMQRVCEHLAKPNKKRPEHLQPERLQHYGLLRRKTFRRLRVRRCFAVRRTVGRTYAENAAERKETGKFPCLYGCGYRQFTRGSTQARGMNGINTPNTPLHTGITPMYGGANDNISNKINEQYHGEMYCRGT